MPRKLRTKLKKRNAATVKKNEFDLNLVRDFLRAYTPTERDIRRKMKPDELVALCQRVHCRVDMTRWNAVNDFVTYFRRQGRLLHKSFSEINQLVAKAVNRHKAQVVYTDSEIQEHRFLDWGLRKKENLLRLRLWAYDEKKAKEFFDILCESD